MLMRPDPGQRRARRQATAAPAGVFPFEDDSVTDWYKHVHLADDPITARWWPYDTIIVINNGSVDIQFTINGDPIVGANELYTAHASGGLNTIRGALINSFSLHQASGKLDARVIVRRDSAGQQIVAAT